MQYYRMDRRRQRRRKKIFMISLCVIMALALTYLLISLYFRNHFYFGTEINGLQVGGLSAEKAKEKIAAKVGDYLLILYDRDGNHYRIMGNEIDCEYVPDEAPNAALKDQNMFGWFPALFRKNQIDVDTPMIYDSRKLEEKVASLSCFQEENIIQPRDAYLERTKEEYRIVPEIWGTKMIPDKVTALVGQAVTEGEGTITLTDEAYENPTVTSEDPKLVDVMNRIEGCINAVIYYKIADYDEKLDSDTIFRMMQVNENYEISLDERKVADFVQGLATKYNTYADTREFLTSSGDVIKIGGGDYGWVIHKEKEAEQLKKDVLSGQSVTREPVYSQRARVEGLNDIGTTYVEIDYTKQHMWYYKEGQLILESDIVSGNIATGNGSPDGLFKIVYKQSPAVLRGEDYESDVDYFMPFAYNVGIHDASWRTQFGGEYYKTSGSHGCINAPGEVAKSLYGQIEVGTPVIAYYREPVELTAENCRIANAYSYVEPKEEDR